MASVTYEIDTTFHCHLDLRSFPWDCQDLPVTIQFPPSSRAKSKNAAHTKMAARRGGAGGGHGGGGGKSAKNAGVNNNKNAGDANVDFEIDTILGCHQLIAEIVEREEGEKEEEDEDGDYGDYGEDGEDGEYVYDKTSSCKNKNNGKKKINNNNRFNTAAKTTEKFVQIDPNFSSLIEWHNHAPLVQIKSKGCWYNPNKPTNNNNNIPASTSTNPARKRSFSSLRRKNINSLNNRIKSIGGGNNKNNISTSKDNSFSVVLRVERMWYSYLWRVIVVLCVISLCSVTSFCINVVKEGHSSRMAHSTTMFLTAVAFQFVVSSSLPHLEYLTLLDKYILLQYLIITTVLVTNATHSYLGYKGDYKGDGKWIGFGLDGEDNNNNNNPDGTSPFYLFWACVGWAAINLAFALFIKYKIIPTEKKKLL